MTVSTGIITTIAGTGTSSYSGDNGPATSATLNSPQGVAVDPAGTYSLCRLACYLRKTNFNIHHIGNVYIADYNNHRVRKVTVSTGIITTIAGTGTTGFSGDNGPATSAEMYRPEDVAVDSAGDAIFNPILF